MHRYDTEYYDQKVIPHYKGRFVRYEDINSAIQALRLIALGMAENPQKLAEGVIDDLNIHKEM